MDTVVWRALERELCRGRRVRLLQRVYETSRRDSFVRDIVVFGESVGVVPLLEGDRVVLLRQYRAPFEKWIYEIPAGRVEDGESVEEAARRELVEETGYYPGRLVYIKSFYPTPGYSDEVLHLFLGTELVYQGQRPEKGELLEVVVMGLGEAIETVMSQDPVDAKTLIGLLLTRDLLERRGLAGRA